MHSASLPLLEGLYGRPEALEETVKEALARFEAARKIARWTSSCFRLEASTSYHQKHKKRKLEYKKKKPRKKKKRDQPNQFIISSNSASWEHWIFQSLLSPNLRVRQVASCFLLQGPTTIMREALVSFADRHTTCPGDIQIFGLIKHFLAGEEESFVASGGLRWLTRSIVNLISVLHPSHAPSRISLPFFR